MSRTLGRPIGAGSAFDFDVITDVPRPPSRRPEPAPPERAGDAKHAEAESRPDADLGAKPATAVA